MRVLMFMLALLFLVNMSFIVFAGDGDDQGQDDDDQGGTVIVCPPTGCIQ